MQLESELVDKQKSIIYYFAIEKKITKGYIRTG